MPTAYQAGVNSSLRHYFKAVAATGSVDPETMIVQMRGARVLLPRKLH
jgi:branched-chain amino acid transport system substrate-binding protein